MAVRKEELLEFYWCNFEQYFQNCKTESGEIISVDYKGYESDNETFDYKDVVVSCKEKTSTGYAKFFANERSWLNWSSNNTCPSKLVIVLVASTSSEPIIETFTSVKVVKINFPEFFHQKFFALSLGNTTECCEVINSLNSLDRISLYDNLLIDRIDYKLSVVNKYFIECRKDWLSTLYYVIFDTFMIGTSQRRMMVELCKAIKFHKIIAQLNSLEQVEALIMGCAGLLNINTNSDEYIFGLSTKFDLIMQQHKLCPIYNRGWGQGDFNKNRSKWLQLAQLSSILYNSKHILMNVSFATTIQDLDHLLSAEPSPYWREKSSPTIQRPATTSGSLTQAAKNKILINGLIPFWGFFQVNNLDIEYYTIRPKLADMYVSIKAELNNIVNGWTSQGVVLQNSADTQAIIHLTKNYCNQKLCTKCTIGKKILVATLRR